MLAWNAKAVRTPHIIIGSEVIRVQLRYLILRNIDCTTERLYIIRAVPVTVSGIVRSPRPSTVAEAIIGFLSAQAGSKWGVTNSSMPANRSR